MIGSAISIMNNISNMKLAHDLDNVNITNKPGNNKDLADAFENQAESNVANARVNREAAYQMDPEYGQYYMGSPAEDYAMHAADRAFYDSINTKIDTLKAGLNSGRITDAEYRLPSLLGQQQSRYPDSWKRYSLSLPFQYGNHAVLPDCLYAP